MDQAFWHEKWNSDNIPFNQKQPNPFMVKFFNRLNLKPGSTIFAPLCGKSVDLVWLAEQGFKVIGSELNYQACKDFYHENAIPFKEHKEKSFHFFSSENITLLAGDFFELSNDIIGKIDAIYDRASLIALPSDTRLLYAEKIINLTNANTHLFLITIGYKQSQMQGPPFSVNETEVYQLYSQYFHIETVHNKRAKNIPLHLQAKGLIEANDLVFSLLKK
tara:strand:- start:42688 stop:43344 length:657 start_codon:yes stop_codon:yes gene_type:complete